MISEPSEDGAVPLARLGIHTTQAMIEVSIEQSRSPQFPWIVISKGIVSVYRVFPIRSHNSRRNTFPIALRGKASMKTMSRGRW